jgi:hypothetical protein
VDVCEACGERNPAGSAFCVYCGVYLGWDQRDGDDQSAAPTATNAAQTTATAPPATGPASAGGGPYAGGQPGAGGYPGQAPASPGGQPGAYPGGYQGQPPQPAQPYGAPPGGSPYDVTAPQPTIPQPAVGPPVPPGQAPCPSCGNPNPTSRRFCGKCGQALRPGTGTAGVFQRQQHKRSWWQRFRDPVDRKARRDYRRSLPPLYRWRRVLILLVSLLGVTGLLYALGRDPIGWVKDKWYEVRGTFVAVDTIGFQADPAASVVRGYTPGALGTPEPDDAWATFWDPGRRTATAGCDGRLAATGKVRLNFAEPTRVRRLEVVAGLPASNQNRPFLYRPKRMYVIYEGGCSTIDLRDTADVQKIDIDTTSAVGAITLAIGDAYPARPDAPRPQVALTTVTPLARPN